ncbi:MAG: type III-B CRISPR module RAMP protein Cmr1 [Desulfovibrio sp. S3730MH75]|nr:MAG: type III-B CRISPR module RAMP protein Cmr1 [Desulfovibrio sp. S3730MH75]
MRTLLLDSLPDFISGEGQFITRDFKFELITPMFGGDSKSWELNLEAPVRAQSVKGQLRFWWRTMQNETDCTELLKKENALWGGESGNDIRCKSKVILEVKNQTVSDKNTAKLNSNGTRLQEGEIPAYVAFPVRDAIKNDKLTVYYVTKCRFTLRLSFPAVFEADVLKTLKLWTLLGGVGARTRRGCGSLYCEELLSEFEGDDCIKQFINVDGDASQQSYCRLAGATLAVSSSQLGHSEPDKVWKRLINSYRDFRQSRKSDPKYGRSYWPEPDAIRRLTRYHSSMHAPTHPDGVWFPRAAFGLPIITQFNQNINGNGDPEPIELKPENASRWPSPVIIKVIKLRSKLLNVVLLLNQEFPDGMELKYSKAADRTRLNLIQPVPATAHPDNYSGKTMRTNDPLKGRSVHKALFDALGVKVI